MIELILILYFTVAGIYMGYFFGVGEDVIMWLEEHNEKRRSDKRMNYSISFILGLLWPIIGVVSLFVWIVEKYDE